MALSSLPHKGLLELCFSVCTSIYSADILGALSMHISVRVCVLKDITQLIKIIYVPCTDVTVANQYSHLTDAARNQKWTRVPPKKLMQSISCAPDHCERLYSVLSTRFCFRRSLPTTRQSFGEGTSAYYGMTNMQDFLTPGLSSIRQL